MVYRGPSNAVDQEMIRFTKQTTARGESRPDCSESLGTAAGAKYVLEYYETHSYDPSEPPFDCAPEPMTIELD